MKMLFFCFLLLIGITACNCDDDTISTDTPDCIKSLYEPGPDKDTSLLAVKRMVVGDEYHYFLNTGQIAYDGPEYIVDENCDIVCVFCFCPYDPCLENYQGREWEIVWEK